MANTVDEAPQNTRIPLWRLVFDQGCITKVITDHNYRGTGTEEDPFEVSWLDNDIRNPMNFGIVFKWAMTLLVGLDTFAIALVSSAYSGSVNEIVADFRISEEIALLGISLFVVGFAVGPLVWAPLSEIYGRRYILIASSAGLTAFAAGSGGSQNIETLIILRFFAGALGSAPFAVAGGVIADSFPAISRGLASGLFCAAPFLGPTVGPIVGGFLSESAGWRWVEYTVAIFAGVLGIAVIFLLPETYAPVLLQKRAHSLSQKTGKVYRSKLEIEQGKKNIGQVFKVALSRPWVLLFREPIVLLLSIYLSIVYGILYLLFAAMPIVYQLERGWSEGVGGLSFLGVLVGIMFSTVTIFPIYFSYKKKALATNGLLAPEARLPPAFVGAVSLTVGLFWFAWTNSPSIHWMASIAAGVPIGYGMIMVFLPILNYLIDTYTIYAASVLAANASLRSLFGAAFPLFTTYMYGSLGIHWATSVTGFLALACMPMPFIFYKYGPAIRQRCHYAAQSEDFMKMLYGKSKEQQKDTESKVSEDNDSTMSE